MKYRVLFWLSILFLLPLFVFIPNVKAATSITYDSTNNIITITGYTEGTPCTFNNLWSADKAGTYELEPYHDYDDTNETFVVHLDKQPRPADYKEVQMFFNVTEYVCNTTSIRFATDGDTYEGDGITEDIFVDSTGIFYTADNFASINSITFTTYPDYGTYNITFNVYQGQWGVVWKTGTTQYMFDCRVVIGDGSTSTWFADTNKQVTFSSTATTANYHSCIEVKANGNLKFGVLEDATEKLGSQGILLETLDATHYYVRLIYTANTVKSYLYGCYFRGQSGRGNRLELWQNSHVYNCEIEYALFYGGSVDAYDVTIRKTTQSISYTVGTFDRTLIYESDYAVYVYGTYAFNVSNLVGRNLNDWTIYALSITTDKYFVNPDFDAWTNRWVGTSTAEIYRQYTFDLTVTYSNGTAINGTSTGARATIQHYGQGGAVDYNATLGDNGAISTQILSMGFYNQTGGDTIYSYNPYNLQVTNITGYDDYSMNFTLSEETDWNIILNETSTPVTYTSAILVAVAFLVIPLCAVMFIVWRRH